MSYYETIKAREVQIITAALDGLLEKGYTVRVSYEDEISTGHMTDRDAIMAELFACDLEGLHVYQDKKKIGTVTLVHGNDGSDVIADNSVSLEDALAKATAIADEIAEQEGL